MRFFLGGVFLALMIFAIFKLIDDSTPQAGWNDNCEYGNEYIMPDGTVVQHSDCK